jgi:hypothetical protein
MSEEAMSEEAMSEEAMLGKQLQAVEVTEQARAQIFVCGSIFFSVWK